MLVICKLCKYNENTKLPTANANSELSYIFETYLLREKLNTNLRELLLKRLNLSIQYWIKNMTIMTGIVIGTR